MRRSLKIVLSVLVLGFVVATALFFHRRRGSEQLSAVVGGLPSSQKHRLTELHRRYQQKETLSRVEQIALWNDAAAFAQDKRIAVPLRADAVWIFGGVGMLLRHEKALTQQEIAAQAKFLLDLAADEKEAPKVRSISITALGDLKIEEAIEPLQKLLGDEQNYNRPELARASCIALANLAPEKAVTAIGPVLSKTKDAAVFGSAAYALGRTNSLDALPELVANRSRLGDNLSVDNAVEALSGKVFETLKGSADNPRMIDAVKATRSLWREEQKAEYLPLLRNIVAAQTNPVEVRREALRRLIEDSNTVSLETAKQRLAPLVPLIEKQDAFKEEFLRIQQTLNVRVLEPTREQTTP
jgi:hypothetical protein